MKKTTLIGLLLLGSTIANADVTRHPLPNNSTFPIAQAVEVSADTTLVYHSGTLPRPAAYGCDHECTGSGIVVCRRRRFSIPTIL